MFIYTNQTDISYYRSGLAAKKGKCRVFCGLDETYSNVAVVALGKKGIGYSELEELDEGRENVRAAVSGMCSLWQFCHPFFLQQLILMLNSFIQNVAQNLTSVAINVKVSACLFVLAIRPVM